MNLTALIAGVQERLGVPSTDSMFTSGVCTNLINSALHMNEMDADWPWLETSETIAPVNGQENYTPNANWLRTLELQWGDYPPLTKVDIRDLRAIGSPAGRPQFYAVYGDQLRVRPVPTGTTPTMTHLYIRTQPDLSSGSDSPLMPANFHYAIVELAAYLGFRRIHQLPEAGGAQAAYQEWLKRMLARVERVSPSPGGGAAPAATPGTAPVAAP